MSREEKRLAKMAEYRASLGLPPKIEAKPVPKRRSRKQDYSKLLDTRIADRIDGYDRDNLGESYD